MANGVPADFLKVTESASDQGPFQLGHEQFPDSAQQDPKQFWLGRELSIIK